MSRQIARQASRETNRQKTRQTDRQRERLTDNAQRDRQIWNNRNNYLEMEKFDIGQ